MATLTDLRKRLRGVQTICQLAGAMRTVSSAKLARLSSANYAFAPYAQGCRELLQASGAAVAPPAEGSERTLAVLLSGNRGLCGAYHSELFSFFHALPEAQNADYITCGRMAASHLSERGIPVLEDHPMSDVPEYGQAEALADRLLALYAAGKAKRVIFIYSEAVNAMTQTPKCVELLPGTAGAPARELDWLPDLSTAREGLVEFCLRAQVFSLMLSCAMGVQGATLNSMRSAYDNGSKSAAELETAINRLRQTQVTASVIETSSGLRPREEG